MAPSTKRIAYVVVAVLGLSGATYGAWRWHAAHAKPDVVFKTAPVEKRRIVAKVTASGTVSAIVTVQVGSQVSGRIQKLNADFNSKVTKGELIAKIDPQLFEAAVEQSTANYTQAAAALTKAQAGADLADKQLARVKSLHDQGLAAQQDVDAAEGAAASAHADVAVARANVDQTHAALNQTKVNLSYTNILSPIDGVVISRSVDVGQTVAASLQAPILFTIAEDLRKMQVDTNVSEGDVGRLKEGMPASFTVDAFPGQRFKGTIGTIRNAASTVQNVVTYDAVIKVDNDDLKLRPGMTANVTIIWAERDQALAVPNAALRFRPPDAPPEARKPGKKGDAADDTRTVYVVRGVAATPVQIHAGLTDGTVTEVVGGELQEGDAVAIDVETGSAAAASASTPTTNPLGGGGGGGGGRRF
ncbi:MAG TPA: efflux RND transporter periplasmic adaptor subunit [Polyangiaceae bacterium]|nr:efflux RND transporter periplasmic adaptor subunit [Polyangiaceae bacterium]